MRSGLYVDGKWTTPARGETFPVVNPATEEVIHHAASTSRRATRGPWRKPALN